MKEDTRQDIKIAIALIVYLILLSALFYKLI